MTYERLHFKHAAEVVSNPEVGLLILVDDSGTRQLCVPCDHLMMDTLLFHTSCHDMKPFLLPSVVWQIVRDCQPDVRYEVRIEALVDGRYLTYLCRPSDMQAFPMRFSDAVLLAVSADLDILIRSDLMKRQATACSGEDNRVALPVNVITEEMLKEALEKAIEREEYERASEIRDELKRRKK